MFDNFYFGDHYYVSAQEYGPRYFSGHHCAPFVCQHCGTLIFAKKEDFSLYRYDKDGNWLDESGVCSRYTDKPVDLKL